MVDFLKKLLNIHPDKNQKLILWAEAISTLLYTYSSPMLVKTIYSELPSEWIAAQSLVISIFALIIGMLWQGKIREKAIKFFLIIAISESTAGLCLAVYLFVFGFNPWVFGIGSLIYTSFIAIFVSKCIMYFKSRLWIEAEREKYDNNQSVVMELCCIIGFLIALLAMPPLHISVLLWGVCCILDDIGWIMVFLKNKPTLKFA